MSWCDPCAADPLSNDELRQLGVFWADGSAAASRANVFLTRLHVRYDDAHFPEDLVFQETADRANFQGRYVLRHAWTGADSVPALRRPIARPLRASRARSASARVAHRLEPGRDSKEDGAGSAWAGRTARVVGADLEEMTRWPIMKDDTGVAR